MGSAEHPIEPAPRFAIIGYAARFPGAQDADGFWDVLREGRDAVSEVPKDRWDVGRILRRGSRCARQDRDASCRFRRRRDGIRRAVLRDVDARGQVDGPAASAVAGDRVARGGAFRDGADGSGRHQHRGVHGFVHPRLPGNGIRRADVPRDRGLHGHRNVERRGGGPDQLSAGAAGPRGRRRYGVQFVAGGHPSGVPSVALGRMRSRPGRRRERPAHPRDHDHVLQRAHARARRPVQDVRRGRGRLCARRGMRRHRHQAARGCDSRR